MANSRLRRLYFVRHGQAKSEDEDPARGLTDAGRADVTRMAHWAAAAGIQVDEIRHSGKRRAQQTAELFAEHLGANSHEVSGLTPNDDVAKMAAAIESETKNLMLVGHLPFLERLAALLIAGDSEANPLTLDAGALLELTAAKQAWQLTCLMQPRMLPDK